MSVYKRNPGKDSHWWVRFRINKQEIRRSSGTSDKKKAEEFEHRLRSEAYDQKRLGKRPTYLWDDATKLWFRDAELRGIRASTLKNNRLMCDWFDQSLSNARLDAIDANIIAEIRDTLIELPIQFEGWKNERTRSYSTINRYLSFLRAVLRHAHKKNLCDEPPAIELLKEPSSIGHALSPAESKKLLAELRKRKRAPHAAAMTEFGLETGLRWSNIAKLKWKEVRFATAPEKSHLHVDAKLSKSGKPIAIPLSDRAAEILRAQVGQNKTYVFSYNGKPVRSIKKAFQRAATDAGMPDLRFHDLRHTWATRHIVKGTPLKIVAELGGWSSTQMLERRYAHLRRDDLASHV